jgi:hypothetical protein
MLPSRDHLTLLLGTPTAGTIRSDEISYQYRLAPCGVKSSMVANLRIPFGDTGELHRADASYFRYSVAVDLTSSNATATVELN